jgi:TonB family protein
MRRCAFLSACAAFSYAVPVHAVSKSPLSVQNVRFAQQIGPTDLVTPPQVLIHPAAIYTDEARKRRVEGDVIVQAYFDEDGKATPLKVVKGLGYGLDEKALEALYWWRFSPALRNGLPVSVVADIEVPFRFLIDRIEVTADSQELVNEVVHFKGNVLMRVTRNDGTSWILKGDNVTYAPDKIEMQGDARVTIRNPQ